MKEIEVLENEEKLIRDYELDPLMQELESYENGSKKYKECEEKVKAVLYEIELVKQNIWFVQEGIPERSDKDRLQEHCDIINAYREDYESGMHMQTPFEDYGIDLRETGWTEDNRFYVTPYEDKSLSGKYTYSWLETVAGRNDKCRYCSSATTVEKLEADRTPMPKWTKGKEQILALNATDKYGKLSGKWFKLQEAKSGLVVELKGEGGELLVFTPKALQKAFLGYYWIKCEHTTEFNDRTLGWELKAAVDLRKFSYKVPREFIKEYDKCRNS